MQVADKTKPNNVDTLLEQLRLAKQGGPVAGENNIVPFAREAVNTQPESEKISDKLEPEEKKQIEESFKAGMHEAERVLRDAGEIPFDLNNRNINDAYPSPEQAKKAGEEVGKRTLEERTGKTINGIDPNAAAREIRHNRGNKENLSPEEVLKEVLEWVKENAALLHSTRHDVHNPIETVTATLAAIAGKADDPRVQAPVMAALRQVQQQQQNRDASRLPPG